MIVKPINIKAYALIFFCLFLGTVTAQNDSLVLKKELNKNINFYEYRGTNAVEIAAGTSVINGDFADPLFEIFFRIGYKRSLSPHINVNFSYNKFNLAYKDLFNEGFMSFDLNLEYIIMPNKRFSPFLFVGGGLNAANYFEETLTKFQIGGGIEYIVVDGIGLKLFTDYNYFFEDTLDGLEFGTSDDTYFRIGFGVNFYFGGNKKKAKIKDGIKTVINSNLIIPKDNTEVTK